LTVRRCGKLFARDVRAINDPDDGRISVDRFWESSIPVN
jgi:hypothetical protein